MNTKVKENLIVVGCLLISALIILWYVKVLDVNAKGKAKTKYYALNENIELTEITYKATEFKMYTYESLKRVFPNAFLEEAEKNSRYIVAKIEILNTSDKSVEKNYAVQVTSAGFESLQWLSSIAPYLFESINPDLSGVINPGEKLDYYAVTSVNPNCFSKKGWKKIENESFDYVISLYPNPVRIRLGVPEVVR